MQKNKQMTPLRPKRESTQAEVQARMERYCAYQDRCHAEVREKLKDFSLTADEKENIICCLIEGRFLDEERFARSFARGKFRVKQWGRVRISQELRARGIQPQLVEAALGEIGEREYEEVFQSLLEAKKKEAGGLTTRAQAAKVYNFLVAKGYETEKVWEALNVK